MGRLEGSTLVAPRGIGGEYVLAFHNLVNMAEYSWKSLPHRGDMIGTEVCDGGRCERCYLIGAVERARKVLDP